MIILYALLIAYIFAINFYAFLLVKSLRDKERQAENVRRAKALVIPQEGGETGEMGAQPSPVPVERASGKLYIAGLLGGAITIYICMFLLKYKRSDLLLMLLMPLFGVLNIYLFVLLFRSGFSFFVVR